MLQQKKYLKTCGSILGQRNHIPFPRDCLQLSLISVDPYHSLKYDSIILEIIIMIAKYLT